MHFKNDVFFKDENLIQKIQELKLAEARLKELENDVDIAVKRFKKQIQ